jgi:hypothetical protein
MAYCHKHGQWQMSGRCNRCDDELISLGIQSDKDKITELEAFRDAARACLDGYSFEQIEKHACKILKSGI